MKVKTKISIYLFSVLIFLSASLSSSAQEEGSDQYGRNLEELTLNKRGPNKDYYGHLYFGYGFIVGESESDSASIIAGKSSAFNLGWLWKWRISKYYELGFDVSYHYSSFHLAQDSSKIVPTRLIHKREKIVFNNLQVVPFQRFKFRNRYHSNGTFIDLGGYAGWNYRIKNQTVERNKTPGAGKTKTVNLNLQYTEDFSYGLMAPLGFNRFMFYGRYRLSDLFRDEDNLPEFPRFEVGLNIGIHQ
jgi:hypothetical protein